MGHYTFSRELPLPRLLNQLIDSQLDGCLHLSGGVVSWMVYLKRGKLIYATNSIDPFGRFDRYLRRLSIQIPSLVSAIRIQVRLLFEAPAEASSFICRDYEAIDWLVKQRHLTSAQAALLIEELAKEVLESLLSVQEGNCEWIPSDQNHAPPVFCQLDLPSLLEFCQSRLRQRQAVGLPPSVKETRPTSFNPTSAYSLSTLAQQPSSVAHTNGRSATVDKPIAPTRKSSYTIACVDDSPSILKTINSFLGDEFSIIMINDPVKALMQIIRSKPDLVLLDVTMPNLDGYELCSLLRKHPSFRQTPVVMVTSNTGLIDRAKAKLVGSSGFLAKPFTQPDLVKMVFKHLQ